MTERLDRDDGESTQLTEPLHDGDDSVTRPADDDGDDDTFDQPPPRTWDRDEKTDTPEVGSPFLGAPPIASGVIDRPLAFDTDGPSTLIDGVPAPVPQKPLPIADATTATNALAHEVLLPRPLNRLATATTDEVVQSGATQIDPRAGIVAAAAAPWAFEQRPAIDIAQEPTRNGRLPPPASTDAAPIIVGVRPARTAEPAPPSGAPPSPPPPAPPPSLLPPDVTPAAGTMPREGAPAPPLMPAPPASVPPHAAGNAAGNAPGNAAGTAPGIAPAPPISVTTGRRVTPLLVLALLALAFAIAALVVAALRR